MERAGREMKSQTMGGSGNGAEEPGFHISETLSKHRLRKLRLSDCSVLVGTGIDRDPINY